MKAGRLGPLVAASMLSAWVNPASAQAVQPLPAPSLTGRPPTAQPPTTQPPTTQPPTTQPPTAKPPTGPSADALQEATELSALVSAATMADMSSRAIAQAWPPMENALRAQNAKIDAQTLADLRAEFERLTLQSFSEMMKEAPAIYARNFTAEEMREIVAFYRTPAGTKALRVMPQVSSEMLAQMSPRTQALQEKVTLAFLNILQKKGYYAR